MPNQKEIAEATKRIEEASKSSNQRVEKIAGEVVKILQEHQVTVAEVGVVLRTASSQINQKVNKFPVSKITTETNE